MNNNVYSIIVGSGSYIPTVIVENQDFLNNEFFTPDGIRLKRSNLEIIQQFEKITGIRQRRYVNSDLVASDIASYAAKDALASAQIDGETLDYIIVAHNFGDVRDDNPRSDFVPSLASRIKHQLNIKNPNVITYDLCLGCSGWLQGIIQADLYIKSGLAHRILVIGTETLSRMIDPHDRDSMIFSDGAGAVVVASTESTVPVGIIAQTAQSYASELAYLLKMEKSSNPDYGSNRLFVKMQGHKLYESVLKIFPGLIKDCISKAGLSITDIDQVLVHQANNKLDEAILKQLFALYGINQVPDLVMPMTISWLGNSSVATIPTLYNLLSEDRIENYTLQPDSFIVFAAVGAGLNANAIVYKVPR
ncbi:3-oxoacyl-ACP synthase III family protein [Dyadobacter frigoris]|uniref:Ketoacyl-ACP synthase III n=1 Tax=Dyadobacter frigoris TaxID=2576211 RepID=A0A4U6D891_9BACT|nr:ketoacyl-ACP synthase III [Dyadobacter frigoris]TKT92467.1 ketoacyl-ACP synthase III [Dyadobacter frigoris]GLU55257.1 3-oxoacyl-ACP synthase [Dyadobacter frigoris]